MMKQPSVPLNYCPLLLPSPFYSYFFLHQLDLIYLQFYLSFIFLIIFLLHPLFHFLFPVPLLSACFLSSFPSHAFSLPLIYHSFSFYLPTQFLFFSSLFLFLSFWFLFFLFSFHALRIAPSQPESSNKIRQILHLKSHTIGLDHCLRNTSESNQTGVHEPNLEQILL
jgi:hypothetical protein